MPPPSGQWRRWRGPEPYAPISRPYHHERPPPINQIEAFVEHYNHQLHHESLDNVKPANPYFGKAAIILKRRERIKRQTIQHRRLQHRKLAA